MKRGGTNEKRNRRLLRTTAVIATITAMVVGLSMVNIVIETCANDDTSVNAPSTSSTYMMLKRVSTRQVMA